MFKLFNADGSSTNISDAGSPSQVFQTTTETNVHVWVTAGTLGTLVMQCSDDNSTFVTFYPSGVAAAMTGHTTGGFTRLYDLPGGVFWRFTVSGTTDAVIRVSGIGVSLIPV